MGEVFFVIILFFGVIAITAVVFGGWMVVAVIRAIVRAISGNGRRRQISAIADRSAECPYDGCRARNRIDARFCRRCGRTMSANARARHAAIL
jgi:hypothetical protein